MELKMAKKFCEICKARIVVVRFVRKRGKFFRRRKIFSDSKHTLCSRCNTELVGQQVLNGAAKYRKPKAYEK